MLFTKSNSAFTKKFLMYALSALFVINILFGTILSSSAYATDNTCVYAMTGRLYYFDTPSGKIVFKNVKPAINIPSSSSKEEKEEYNNQVNLAKAAAKNAEYTEIPTIANGLFFSDGVLADPGWINEYADSNVWFIVTVKDGQVISVPFLKILV